MRLPIWIKVLWGWEISVLYCRFKVKNPHEKLLKWKLDQRSQRSFRIRFWLEKSILFLLFFYSPIWNAMMALCRRSPFLSTHKNMHIDMHISLDCFRQFYWIRTKSARFSVLLQHKTIRWYHEKCSRAGNRYTEVTLIHLSLDSQPLSMGECVYERKRGRALGYGWLFSYTLQIFQLDTV